MMLIALSWGGDAIMRVIYALTCSTEFLMLLLWDFLGFSVEYPFSCLQNVRSGL